MDTFKNDLDTSRKVDSLSLNNDKAWDTFSVLAKLVEAADILLHKKDYDGHGWEEIETCYKIGLEILQKYNLKGVDEV